MKKPNITEGEWLVSGEIDGKKTVSAHDGECKYWVSLCYNTINAKAISAVPEMIDALIAVDHFITDTRHRGYTIESDFRKISTIIEEALKKAGCE